jgi:hypothetical protein
MASGMRGAFNRQDGKLLILALLQKVVRLAISRLDEIFSILSSRPHQIIAKR